MSQIIDVPGQGQVEFPDGMSDQDIVAAIKRISTPQRSKEQMLADLNQPAPSLMQDIGNLGAGALRGAASIGSTILAPYDVAKDLLAGKGLTLESNRARRQAIDTGLSGIGADTQSGMYQAGKIGAEIAGTAGTGGALAKAAPILSKVPALAPYADKVAAALRSGGFSLGGAPAETARQMLSNAALRVGGGAAVGGASAGLVNPEDTSTGAAIGGAIPVVGKVMGEAGRAVKAGVYDPFVNKNQLIASALRKGIGEQNLPDVISSLGAKAQTPGVNLSAGESTGSEALSALEDAIKAGNPGGALSAQAQSNRAALADALRNIGQDEGAIQAAKQARSAATEPLYTAAKSQFVKPDIEIANLLQRPAMKDAWARAARIAENAGEPITDTNGQMSVNGLHYLKMGIDDMLSDPSSGIGKAEKSAVLGLKDKLVNWMGAASPEYGQALSQYAEMSKPINQMQIGQKLANTFIPATSGDIPASVNAASLAKALRNPDALAQGATGYKGATYASTMSPEQMSTISGVSSDASRIAEAAKRGAGFGSATARRLMASDFIGQNFAERAPTISKVVNAIANVPGVGYMAHGIGAIGGMATSKMNQQMVSKLEDLLAKNPEGLKVMLQKELASLPAGEQEKVLNIIPKGMLVSVPAVAAIQ